MDSEAAKLREAVLQFKEEKQAEREKTHVQHVKDHLAAVAAFEDEKKALAVSKAALERQLEEVSARERDIAAQEEAAAKAIQERDALSQVAARVTEVENGFASAKAVHDDHMKLYSFACNCGWTAYKLMHQAIVDLEIPVPNAQPTPSVGSLGGLEPTFTSLATALMSTKAWLDVQLKEGKREAGLTCALNALELA